MTQQQYDQELIKDMARFTHDPLAFVLYAFPWGEGELKDKTGPRKWQRDLLEKIGQELRNGKINNYQAIQTAISSGHGIGKSALVAWLILWAISTFPDTRGVVTANTENQLKQKTFGELAVWYRRCITKHWFELTATSLFSLQPEHEKTWRVDMVPWSERNTEAFAGLHAEGRRILLIFDEASAIPDIIWEVAEGALTDANTEILWCVFGNPTRNSGRFKEAFGRLRHRWFNQKIDSRTVEGTNKTQLQSWVDDYGESSDFVKVRVRGEFPSASSMQFIPTLLVEEAMKREPYPMLGDPLIMSLDVARGGDDNCVFGFRRGLDAKTIPFVRLPGSDYRDSMKLVSKAVHLINEYKPDAIFVDATGVGGPIADRLRQLGYNVIDVQFGSESPHKKRANLRAHMWAEMLEWLKHGSIADDPVLEADLTGPEYSHNAKDELILEKKEHMKSRGLASPDCFIAGTIVTTPSGGVPIELIKIGDVVVTPLGDRKVIATQESEQNSVTSVKFSNGVILSGKGKHKVFTWNKGWTRLDALSITDVIETNSFTRLLTWKLLKKLYITGTPIGFKAAVDTMVQTKKMRRSDFFIGGFGMMLMERYQKVTRFITEMAIGQIINYPTLRLSSPVSISDTICLRECVTLSLEKNLLKTWREQEMQQPSGTAVQKASSGIVSKAKNLGNLDPQEKGFVRFVTKVFSTFASHGDSVQMHVCKNHVTSRIRQRVESVLIAIKSFFTIVTVNRSVVPEIVVTNIEPNPVKFYNLTLDYDNVYYANGILVANCGDALAMTFAQKVVLTGEYGRMAEQNQQNEYNVFREDSYDPFRNG